MSPKSKKTSNENKLLRASKNGDLNQVKMLLKKGVDVNCITIRGIRQGWTPLHRACYYGHIKIVHYLLVHKAQIFHEDHASLLHVACCSVKVEMVQWLLKNGFLPTKINAFYDTPLHNLVANGPAKENADVLQIAQMLIDKGAVVDYSNRQGKTPLHLAVMYTRTYDTTNLIALMQLLLNNGANINNLISNVNYDNGSSLLHLALSSVGGYRPIPNFGYCFTICEFLIHNGINTNSNRFRGKTALHLACNQGNYIVVELLVNNGAGIHIRDNNGLIPLEIMRPLLWNERTYTNGDLLTVQEGEDYFDIRQHLLRTQILYRCGAYAWLKQSWLGQQQNYNF